MPSTRALCALLLALAGCSAAGGGEIVPSHPNVISYPAKARRAVPAFSVAALRGGPPITQASIAGKVAVVNFWGSWCGPCRREEPMLEQLWKTYGARGVVFLGVDERDQIAAGKAFQDEFGVTYPSMFDPSSEATSLFGVKYMPATYVIDASGRIAGEVVGGLQRSSDLTALLDGVLAA